MNGRRTRVLFVSSWYPSRINPTLGNFVQKHAGAAALYADVMVLHVCFDEAVRSREPEIVFDDNTSARAVYLYCRKASNPAVRLIRYLRAYRLGLKIVADKGFSPDLIHANVVYPVGLLFYFLKDFRKYPYVITEHWAGYLDEYPSGQGTLQKHFLRRIIGRAAFMLPVTSDLGKAMQDLGFACRYEVIPNVTDTSLFTVKNRERSAVCSILHVSSFDDEQKNITGIIRVIERLYEKRQDFVVNFISDGRQEPFIAMSEKSGLLNKAIFFHGRKSTAEVAGMMQESDLLLLFSNYENLPCVIVEAYACGIPVISTDVGGISEHHTPGHGILVKARDEDGLLNALHDMIDNQVRYDRQYLHDYAEKHFSYDVVGRKFHGIYKKVTGSGV